MRIIAALFALALCAAPAAAQQRRPGGADAAVKAAFPTAPADWAPRLTRRRHDAAMLGAPEQPAEGRRRRDPEARAGEHRLSARQQLHWRLEEGRGAGAVRLRAALHRLSGAAGQRRQLLRLPSADQEGSQLRHARPVPRNYGKLRDFKPDAVKALYEKIYNSHAVFPCSTMPRFGANKMLTIEQIKDAVALLMSPESPVNTGQ